MKRKFALVLEILGMSFMLAGCAERVGHSNVPTTTPKLTETQEPTESIHTSEMTEALRISATSTPKPTETEIPTIEEQNATFVLENITPIPTPHVIEYEETTVVELFGYEYEWQGECEYTTYFNGETSRFYKNGCLNVSEEEFNRLALDVMKNGTWYNGYEIVQVPEEIQKITNVKIEMISGPMTRITLELEGEILECWYDWLVIEDVRCSPMFISYMIDDGLYEERIVYGASYPYYSCENWEETKEIIGYAWTHVWWHYWN